jgi:hypothetical protein
VGRLERSRLSGFDRRERVLEVRHSAAAVKTLGVDAL